MLDVLLFLISVIIVIIAYIVVAVFCLGFCSILTGIASFIICLPVFCVYRLLKKDLSTELLDKISDAAYFFIYICLFVGIGVVYLPLYKLGFLGKTLFSLHIAFSAYIGYKFPRMVRKSKH